MNTETFAAVRACSIAMLSGAILHAAEVTAGNGIVVDWRTIRSGVEMMRDGDAFDTARLLVAIVGPDAAMASVPADVEPAPPTPRTVPRVIAFMADHSGGRRRVFEAGPFTVHVEPHGDDAAQAAFTATLAAFCARG